MSIYLNATLRKAISFRIRSPLCHPCREGGVLPRYAGQEKQSDGVKIGVVYYRRMKGKRAREDDKNNQI